jgi:hypothetical protein
MSEVNLEKIDVVRERTGVSYEEAKEALEASSGNVVDAIIYIEKDKKDIKDNMYTTKDELLKWLKDIVKKGNVNRIKIKKDDNVIVDIPVNAGVFATLTALVWPPLIAIGILTAVVTKVTIEITKDDGSVEVVNKILKGGVKSTVDDVKDKVFDKASSLREKFKRRDKNYDSQNTYRYTVKFDDIDDEQEPCDGENDKKDN